MCPKAYLWFACVLFVAGRGAVFAQGDEKLKAFISVCDKRVAGHPYFSKVTMLKWTKNPPFVFYLERPPKDDKNYERLIVNSYLPFLDRLLKIFEREYATRLKLERRGAAPGFAIAVLNSRGSYGNYAQAVRVDALHHFRAHYDHKLQLAVTYVDAFARGNQRPEERHSVLHEFVHALQHAYNTTGRMPRSVWFNEGLAEFHSTSTNSADSLDTPRLNREHLMTLASVLTYSQLNSLFAPLSDLVAAENYADVLKRAKARGANTAIALRVFYAQSSAFVEFLRRGDGGKHKTQFLRFTDAIMRGSGGKAGFEKAFGKANLSALEKSFREYLAAEAQTRLRVHIGTPSAVVPAEVAAKFGNLPPPILYDTSELGWRDEEIGVRVAAARSSCANGNYDAALDLLPAANKDTKTDNEALAERVRSRVVAILQMRNALLDKLLTKNLRMAPLVDGKRQGGRLVARKGDELTLVNGKKTFKLPLSVLAPNNLAKELSKQKLIKRPSWQNAWLSWIGGDGSKKALRYLDNSDPHAAPLRADLTGTFDPAPGAAAVALGWILSVVPAKDPAAAYDQLDKMCAAIRDHSNSPLISRRIEALKECVKALAQRAFSIEDPRCINLSAKTTRTKDGRISVTYKGNDAAIGNDFRFNKAITKSYLDGFPNLATSKTGLTRKRTYYELVGSGVFTWPVPLRGPVVLELRYEMVGGGLWGLVMSTRTDGAYIRSGMAGAIDIFDPKTRLNDSVGAAKVIMADEVHKLRLEFDGKGKVVSTFDGKKVAEVTRVGSLTHGYAGLMVHASMPLRVHSLKLEGKLDSGASLELRKAFVERTLERVK